MRSIQRICRAALFAALLAGAAAAGAQTFGNPWKAEEEGQAILRGALPACCDTSATARACERRASFTVSDCSSVADCSSSGSVVVRMQCTAAGWVAQNYTSVDLSAYAALAGAAFTGPISVVVGEGQEFVVTGMDNSVIRLACVEGQCAAAIAADTVDISDIVGTYRIAVDGLSGVQMTSDMGCVAINSFYWCGATAVAPFGCPVGLLGYYTDTTGPDLCYCDNATSWAPVDGTGTCDESVGD